MFTDYQIQILALLLNNPEREYYLSEIGEILGKRPGVFQRGINSLEKQNYITSRKNGNQRLFKINNNHLLYKEIKNIINKTYNAEKLIFNVIKHIKGIDTALIYGSYAKNKMRSDSDIDLLIVGSHKALDAQKAVLILQNQLNREINIIDMTKKELEDRKLKKEPFIKEILSQPIIKII